MTRMRTLFAVFILALLAGCAAQPPAPSIDRQQGDWSHQLPHLQAMNHWKISGKVGFRSPQLSRSANLDWVQQDSHYDIMVSGPWGVGRNTLKGQPGDVSLQNSQGTFNATTAEALMEQQLGWSLPVSSMDSWIKGIKSPDSPGTFQYDELGYPRVLQQDGWTISYQQWSYAGGYWLPGRMRLTYGDINVIFVVTQWQPNTGS